MAYDMGTSVGHVTLDITGVDDGVKKIQEDFDKVDATTASSISEVENFANTLMNVLSAAYQNVTQNSTAAQAAQQAYNAVLDANEQKMAEYANEVSRAEQNKVKATEHVLELEKSLEQATNTRIAQEQRYAELRENLNVNNRTLISNMEKLNTDLEVERNLRKELNDALKNEDKAAQAVVKAKEKLEEVSVKASNAAQQAQNKIATAEDKAAQAVLSNAVAYEKKKLEVYANVDKASIASVQKIAQTEIQAEKKKISDIEKAKINAQRDVEKANIAAVERAVEKEEELELKAINEETKIKENAVAKIEKAKIDAAQRSADNEKAIRQKAQTDIEKALISQETKLQQTKIQEAEKGARQAAQIEAREREQATKQAVREQEKAAQDISNKQVAAFAIAAKAVDEIVNGVKRLAQELVNLGKAIVDIGSDFETSMAQVAATTGMTATDVSSKISDYQDLVAAAKEAGLTTIYSASQAGEALNYLALAGYNVEQSIATMPDILTIAAAGAMDLSRASDMVTDAMNALDLTIDDTTEFIDKMAKTAQSSNTNVEQLGNAILTVGGTATVLSGGVTELDTALGLLANAGIKARVGGTALRQILLNLTDPSTTAAEKIEELGLEVFDLEGNIRPLKDIFSDLNDIMADFTDQERMEALGAMFDKRQIRSATALMQAVGEKWDTLEAKINNAEGAAERMAETMKSNLNGALNIAKSNLENIAITIYDGIVKNITDLVKEAIPKFQELNKVLASPEVQARLKSMSAELKEIALTLLDKLIVAIPKLIDGLANIKENLASLAIVLGTISAFKIAGSMPQIIAAVEGLVAAINPLTLALTAISATTVIVTQEMAKAEAEIEKYQAAIMAENDLYAQQRDIVAGVIEEWQAYKETSEQVVTDAEDHAQKVRSLYYEYKNLTESGKDATIALEALADEVPDLKDALAEGEVSFQDITKAVDDYCDSLIRAAKLEANKGRYVEAVETRDKLATQLETLEQAAEDSQKALDKWDKRYDELSRKSERALYYGEDFTEEEQEEYQQLLHDEVNGKREALVEINRLNQQALDDTKKAFDDANSAVESAEEDFKQYMIEEGKAQGKYFDDEASAKRHADEEYAKAQREGAKKKAKAQEEENKALIDSINAGLDEVERKVALSREDLDQAKIDYFANYFGTHEDWDRNNKDLVKFYDTYMSLREKKEKEVQAQIEKAQKDRETAAKKSADDLKKSINDSVSDIEWLGNFRGDTAAQQAKALREFVDQNASYYKQFPEEYEKMVEKIATLDKQWLSNTKLTNEELKDYLKEVGSFYGEDSEIFKSLSNIVTETEQNRNKEQAEKFFKEWTDGYNKLADNAVKAYQNIQKSRETFEKNLMSGAELFTQQTGKVWNRFTQQFEESQELVLDKKAYKNATKQLEDLEKVMSQLETKGVDKGILDELWSLDPEEALKRADQLNKMSTGAISTLNSDYQAYMEKAKELSDKYYEQQMADWNEKYWTPLQEYTRSGQKELQEAMALVGEDTVNGFIEGLENTANKATDDTKELMEGVLNSAKEALGIHSPSTEFYEIGEYTIEGFLNGIQSKAEQLANVFLSLGQKAGDAFISAFKQTWENFTGLMDGFTMPVSMITPTFGTPVMAGGQMAYMGVPTTTTGLTKEDIVSAVQEALPSGDVVLTVDKTEFGKISRDALNGLAENSEMGLKV